MLDWILLGGSDIQLGAVDFFAAEAKAEAGADADAGAVQEANNGTTYLPSSHTPYSLKA